MAPSKFTPGSTLPVTARAWAADIRVRRELLRRSLSNGVLVLEGNMEQERGDTRAGFFQEPNFQYLTGWREPGAALLLAPWDDGPSGEVLFLPNADEARILWTGSGASATDSGIRRSTGFRYVEPRSRWESTLRGFADRYEKLICLSDTPTDERLRKAFPFRDLQAAQPVLANARMAKSAPEAAMLREAIRITIAGQLRGWHAVQTSSMEFEVAADITHEFLRRGAQRHSFAPIVASGPNACILHYGRNRSALRNGDLVILDAGAEFEGYSGDLTRTVPVGGRFSRRQRLLYEAVLEVQKEIIRHVSPGTFLSRQIPGSLHHLAVDLFRQLPLGPGRKPLSNYFPHGIGHHLGLEVHDLGDPHAPLVPGAVITIEPGIYIPEERIGIRIEDDVLITDSGSEVLSSNLPKEPDDVEALLKA